MTAGESRSGRVLRFGGFRRTVTDLNRAIDFYGEALGFDFISFDECSAFDTAAERPLAQRCARLRLGEETIELHAHGSVGRHAAGDVQESGVNSTGFQHIAVVTADMPTAFERLRRFSPAMISSDGPVRLPASSGGVTACKFRDTDGHPLELIAFPDGQGDPKWHRSGARQATLGIDHSAIAVSDVERSLSFYAAGLGFELTARQTNRGAEQDHLDGTHGVVVDVVGLQPAQARTPHLELLGYRSPVPRALTNTSMTRELRADRLLWFVEDIQALSTRMQSTKPEAFIGIMDDAPVAATSLLLRDPDGHLLALRQDA